MANKVSIIFEAEDRNTVRTAQEINRALSDIDRTSQIAGRSLDSSFSFAKGSLLADFFRQGASEAVSFGRDAVQAFNQAEAAALGLASVAVFKGFDKGAAIDAVRNLDAVRNGLVSISEASTGVKNLLSTGFNLEQSVTIINRLTDSAAFGRQASLGLGEAVRSATEGIKNQNSVLVDNAGVTKNLSVILKERGFQLEDLDSKVRGAAAREALYQGLLAETQAQVGNASQLSGTFAGKLLQVDAGYDKLLATIGEVIATNPKLIETVDAVAESIGNLTDELKDPNSSTRKFFDDIISGASDAAKIVGGAIDLLKKYREIAIPDGGPDIARPPQTQGDFGLRQAKAVFDAEVAAFKAGGFVDQILSQVLPAGSVRSADGLRDVNELLKESSTALSALTQAIESYKQSQSGVIEIATLFASSGSSEEAGAARLKATFKQFENLVESTKRAEASRKEFSKSIDGINDSFDSLGSKLRSNNPFLSVFDQAEARMDAFVKKFGSANETIIQKYDEMNRRLRATDLFKADIASVERISQLLARQAQLRDGTGFEDAERAKREAEAQKRLDFGKRQAGLAVEVQELQRGFRFDDIERAAAEVRRLRDTPGLIGVALSKQIEEATRGLSIEQLQAGNLLNSRRDALLDIGGAERREETLRRLKGPEKPPEVRQAEEFIRLAQQRFEEASQNPDFDRETGQQILDRTTSAVLSRISPDKLTPDLRDRELEATQRQIEAEIKQRAELTDVLSRLDGGVRGLTEGAFVTALQGFVQALAKGFGIDVRMTDQTALVNELGPKPAPQQDPFVNGVSPFVQGLSRGITGYNFGGGGRLIP